MQRKFMDYLKEWKQEKNKKPLMVMGARQVGKTYIVNEFCKNEYKEYIYINFDMNYIYESFFDNSLDPKDIISKIEAQFEKKN
ncbi:MAG: AAA family ATPase [Clostridia bacterium]